MMIHLVNLIYYVAHVLIVIRTELDKLFLVAVAALLCEPFVFKNSVRARPSLRIHVLRLAPRVSPQIAGFTGTADSL